MAHYNSQYFYVYFIKNLNLKDWPKYTGFRPGFGKNLPEKVFAVKLFSVDHLGHEFLSNSDLNLGILDPI